MKRLLALSAAFSLFLPGTVLADKVIMKDGTVYKGKILMDSDKAVLIGNPPFDPNSYLLEAEDIATISYEEYHRPPPAESRRGFLMETRLGGNVFSGGEMSLGPAASLYTGAGFRIHPLFELDGGIEWLPHLNSGSSLVVTDANTFRQYEKFYMYSAIVSGRFYPLFKKMSLPAEPFVITGYRWSRLRPNGSGDRLNGSGWHLGFGAIRPIARNLFLEGQFQYQRITFDSVEFLGQEGNIRPEITKNVFHFSTGMSYRF